MYRAQDYIQQLADYIKKNLTKGYTVDALKFSLIEQGYSRISVEKAIETANKQLAELAPKMVEKPNISYKIIDESETKVSTSDFQEKKGFLKKLFK